MNTIQDQFLQEVDKLQLNENLGFDKRRIEAINFFKNLGLPTPKHEEWKYSNLKNVATSSFNFPAKTNNNSYQSAFYDHASINVCIVNGILQDIDYNHVKGLVIYSVAQAFEVIPDLMNAHFCQHINIENDAMSALNTSICQQGVVVVVDKNCSIETPIYIHSFLENSQENIAVNVHNLVIVNENAEAKIIETFESKNEKSSFANYITELIVEKSARVDYYKIQNETDATSHVGTTQVLQNEKSYFYSATITLNGGFVRNNLNLVLNGEHIVSHMFGLYMPNKNQHIDNHTLVDHQKPNCESNELYKGILMDNSVGVFNGKIFVREDAQKTNAYQNCRNVIASDTATMNTKPQLEIWADDVKCSHGTTTGKLNDEAIFYMESRGIPKQEAIKMQMFAFANDVVSNIKIEGIREKIELVIQEKLG